MCRYVTVWGGILTSLFLVIFVERNLTYDLFFKSIFGYMFSLSLMSATLWVLSVYLGASISVMSCISFSSYLTMGPAILKALLRGIGLLVKLPITIPMILVLALYCGGLSYLSLQSKFSVSFNDQFFPQFLCIEEMGICRVCCDLHDCSASPELKFGYKRDVLGVVIILCGIFYLFFYE